jgi:hypothetical protein
LNRCLRRECGSFMPSTVSKTNDYGKLTSFSAQTSIQTYFCADIHHIFQRKILKFHCLRYIIDF